MKYLIASHLNNMNIFVNFRNILLTGHPADFGTDYFPALVLSYRKMGVTEKMNIHMRWSCCFSLLPLVLFSG